jgi:hypothetical protein
MINETWYKSLDFSFQSLSEFALHLTGPEYRRGGLDPVQDARTGSRRRAQTLASLTGSIPLAERAAKCSVIVSGEVERGD